MPDWLTKIFASIVSVKTAAIALVTCVGLVLSWHPGTRLIKDSGVPEDYDFFLLVVMIYSCSHLGVEAIIKIWAGIIKIVSKMAENKTERARQYSFKELTDRLIPLLPHPQLDLLAKLNDCEQEFDIRLDGVIYLEQQKYIRRIHKVSRNTSIYEINCTVKDSLISHLESERSNMLSNYILKLTDDEKRFVGLFFSESISEGTRESGIKMKPNIFSAGKSMVHKKMLVSLAITSKTSDKESFWLPSNTAVHLQRDIYKKKPKRTELHLDSDYIIAPCNSGGDGLGSRR